MEQLGGSKKVMLEGVDPAAGSATGNTPDISIAIKARAVYESTMGGLIGEMKMGIKAGLSVLGGWLDGVYEWYQATDALLKVDTGKGVLGHIESFMKNPKNWQRESSTSFQNEWDISSYDRIYGYGK